MSTINGQIVGNKAKGRISKRVFQESKARQNFRNCFLETPVLRFALLPYYQRNSSTRSTIRKLFVGLPCG